MLIGMIDESSRKYLKNSIELLPGVPSNPLIKSSIKDKLTITVNNILLKKLSSQSNFPNLV
jgi:hypothetical protein